MTANAGAASPIHEGEAVRRRGGFWRTAVAAIVGAAGCLTLGAGGILATASPAAAAGSGDCTQAWQPAFSFACSITNDATTPSSQCDFQISSPYFSDVIDVSITGSGIANTNTGTYVGGLALGRFLASPGTITLNVSLSQLNLVDGGTTPWARQNMFGQYVVRASVSCSGIPSPSPIPPGTGTPSGFCQSQSGAIPVFDTVTEGIDTKVYLYRPSPQQAYVCFRADDGTSGYGGMVSITPAVPTVSITGVTLPTVGAPSTDTNASACSTTQPNDVPGSHPAATGVVAGQTYRFDAYSDGATTAWVCVAVGTQVAERLVLPITFPSVGVPSATVGPVSVVSVTPDAGTP